MRFDSEGIYLGATGIRLAWQRVTAVAVVTNADRQHDEIIVTHLQEPHWLPSHDVVQPIAYWDRQLIRDAVRRFSPLVEIEAEPLLFNRV